MARGTYYLPIIQGYEWNVPHEGALVRDWHK